MRMDDNDFYLRVAHALSGCQLVEQELKLYIAEALELVKKCLAGKLSFSMSSEDYENAPLEHLIKTFGKLSNNPPLVAALRKFKDERNFLSHQSIVQNLTPDGELNYRPADFEARLAAIAPEAERLRTAIHEEARKFLAHLYFEDLTANDP
jgi:hypothetical protein